MSTRIGILGYGNLGRGVECAIRQNKDMELAAVFTRRQPADVSILTETAAVANVKDIPDWKDKIDVMILCGGRAQPCWYHFGRLGPGDVFPQPPVWQCTSAGGQ